MQKCNFLLQYIKPPHAISVPKKFTECVACFGKMDASESNLEFVSCPKMFGVQTGAAWDQTTNLP